MAKEMIKTMITVAIMGIIALVGLVQSAQAGSVFDNFNDGNADGWISIAGYPPGTFGNWRVENGVVIQDQGHDGFMFLLDNFPMSSQSVEAKMIALDNGFAGFTIWYKDDNNFVWLGFPYSNGKFVVIERIDGTFIDTPYSFSYTDKTIWLTLRVDANSSTGELAIYLDGDYLATYLATTTNRTGLSGLSVAMEVGASMIFA